VAMEKASTCKKRTETLSSVKTGFFFDKLRSQDGFHFQNSAECMQIASQKFPSATF
jgi:hypothetical protein